MIEVPKGERGVVRLFAIATVMDADLLGAALGATVFDPAQVDIVRPSELDEFGLAGYLTMGMGIPEDQIEADVLARVKEPVAFVRSAAFGGEAQELKTDHPIRLIGTYSERKAAPVVDRLHSDAAQKEVPAPKKRPSDAAMSGRVATIALLVMFALVAVMVWIAG